MKKEAWLSKKVAENIVQCLSCSHKCTISENNRGICGVRKNEKGKLTLLVYGKSIAVNTDPIEKKPLYHFLPGTEIFSIGTVGCNFSCQFCQNWQISQFPKLHSEEEIISTGVELMPEKIIEICKKNKIPSIAFTYNEPAVFFEYAYDIAKLAYQNDIKTVYVSNGFETKKALRKIKPFLSAANIDLKSFSNNFYQKICGANIKPVKENIKWFYENGIWIEVTTLIITGQNDSVDELTKIAKFLASISVDIPWHISRFFPCYKMPNTAVTSAEKLKEAYDIGKKAGLKYVYIGNIDIPLGQNTHCPKCNHLLIERHGYLSSNIMGKNGTCLHCNIKIPGIYA